MGLEGPGFYKKLVLLFQGFLLVKNQFWLVKNQFFAG